MVLCALFAVSVALTLPETRCFYDALANDAVVDSDGFLRCLPYNPANDFCVSYYVPSPSSRPESIQIVETNIKGSACVDPIPVKKSVRADFSGRWFFDRNWTAVFAGEPEGHAGVDLRLIQSSAVIDCTDYNATQEIAFYFNGPSGSPSLPSGIYLFQALAETSEIISSGMTFSTLCASTTTATAALEAFCSSGVHPTETLSDACNDDALLSVLSSSDAEARAAFCASPSVSTSALFIGFLCTSAADSSESAAGLTPLDIGLIAAASTFLLLLILVGLIIAFRHRRTRPTLFGN